MSRVGKNPVTIPSGVVCEMTPQGIKASGRRGTLFLTVPDCINFFQRSGQGFFEPSSTDRRAMLLWGTIRSLFHNIVTGVDEGYTINLEIEGVGYRADIQDGVLKLKLGYSHDISMNIPSDIEVQCQKPTLLSLCGADRQRVGQFAAQIMRLRKLDPYKGKGIRRSGQFVVRKEGKKK